MAVVTDHPVQIIPGTVETAVAWHQTGLAGTIGYRIVDNVGITTRARATAGITEYPAGSGIYQATVPNFGNAGFYTIVWDDFTRYDAIPLTVVGVANWTGVSTLNLMLTRVTAGIVSADTEFGAAVMTETLTVTTAASRLTFAAVSLTATAAISTAGVAFTDAIDEWFGITSLTKTFSATTAGSINNPTVAFDFDFATPAPTAAVFSKPEPELVGAFARPFA